jgi:hypothetical protein
MAGFRVAILAMLVSMRPGIAAQQGAWGPIVDGLKMLIAVNRNAAHADAELQITVKNVSDEPIFLPLGQIRNQGTLILWFRVFVTTSDGAERIAIPGPAKIGGSFAITPLTVELVPNASYTAAIPLGGMEDLNNPTDLKALASKASRLRAELDTTHTECPERCVPGIVFPCWRGKLPSNTLRFPK